MTSVRQYLLCGVTSVDATTRAARRKPKPAPIPPCYLTISQVRDMLGYPQDQAGYKRTVRLLRQAGALVKVGRRSMVSRDSLGASFPDLALRFAMQELDLGDDGDDLLD